MPQAKGRRKKTESTLLNVWLVWDMSGSMGAVWDAAIEGANDYLHKLRLDEQAENMRFSITVFDTVFEHWYEDVKIDEIPSIGRDRYVPRGNTALNDAVADTITRVDTRLKGDRAEERVLIVVLTDGLENSSQEYPGHEGTKRLAQLIKAKEDTGRWTFIYLGAGSPAQVARVAESYNIPAGNAAAYAATPTGTHSTFAVASGVTVTASASPHPASRTAFSDAGYKSVLEQESEEDQN